LRKIEQLIELNCVIIKVVAICFIAEKSFIEEQELAGKIL
jgi:hypothetical protein